MVPQRRETTHRKAKGRSILNSLQNRAYGLDSNQADDLEEPPEFVDSDSDPAWTPQKVVVVVLVAVAYITTHGKIILLLTTTSILLEFRMMMTTMMYRVENYEKIVPIIDRVIKSVGRPNSIIQQQVIIQFEVYTHFKIRAMTRGR